MRVAVIGHDAGDAALQRRVRQMQGEGHVVRALTLRRGADEARPWENVDLGRTRDAAFAHRALAIARAVPRAAAAIGTPDIVWARNLDAAAIALGVLSLRRLATPLVYECLDVHRLASSDGAASRAVRALEARVLARAAVTVVSSTAFVEKHFAVRYGKHPFELIENRPDRRDLPPRPTGPAPERPPTIGWFGVLRCARSLDLLLEEAAKGSIRLLTAGRPANDQLPDFDRRVGVNPNARHLGPYEAGGLGILYGQVDLAWAADWFQAEGNSRWLLPNRLYEGGWFGVPAMAVAGTETARWLEAYGIGVTLEEPVERTLSSFLRELTREKLDALRADVLGQPEAVFAAPPDEVTGVLERAACRA